MLNRILFIVLIGITVSCEKEDPIVPNEEELITTLTYTLTPENGGSIVTFNFQDLDGDGGNAPVITEGVLSANTTYSGTISLLNEQESPSEDITAEVREEALEHQLFFSSNISDLNISYSDMDSNGDPLGIETSLSTGAASSGSLTITLRHEPNKSASGVNTGNIANAGGETDIEVTFAIDVQ